MIDSIFRADGQTTICSFLRRRLAVRLRNCWGQEPGQQNGRLCVPALLLLQKRQRCKLRPHQDEHQNKCILQEYIARSAPAFSINKREQIGFSPICSFTSSTTLAEQKAFLMHSATAASTAITMQQRITRKRIIH